MGRKKLTKAEKEILEGEEERKLILAHQRCEYGNGSVHDYTIKAKISKKTFTLFEKNNYKGERVKFSKDSNDSEQTLGITLESTNKKTVRCNLGHEHVTETEEREWHWFRMPWEHVQTLIEWLQKGNYSQVTRPECERWEVLLKESIEFCELAQSDKLLNPHAHKLKTKIKNYLRSERSWHQGHDQSVPKKLIDEGWIDATKKQTHEMRGNNEETSNQGTQ